MGVRVLVDAAGQVSPSTLVDGTTAAAGGAGSGDPRSIAGLGGGVSAAKGARMLTTEARQELGKLADDLESELGERTRKSLDNDGRADGELGKDPKKSRRDKNVAQLEDSLETKERRSSELSEELAKVMSETKAAYEKADTSGKARKKFDDRVGKLRTLITEAQRTTAQYFRDETRLRDERILNMLTSAAHVAKLPEAARKVLEGSTPVRLRISEDVGIDNAEAVFDPDTGTIEIGRALLDELELYGEDLYRRGIVDMNGNIKDRKGFDEDTVGDQVIATAALIGVHEVTHSAQQVKGSLDATYAAIEEHVSTAAMAALEQGLDPSAATAQAEVEAESFRVSSLEAEAYARQEEAELLAGKFKERFVTLYPDGKRRPMHQIVSNVLAHQAGQPLPYGGTGSSTPVAAAGLTEDLAGRRTPGRRTPGRRTPGRRTP